MSNEDILRCKNHDLSIPSVASRAIITCALRTVLFLNRRSSAARGIGRSKSCSARYNECDPMLPSGLSDSDCTLCRSLSHDQRGMILSGVFDTV